MFAGRKKREREGEFNSITEGKKKKTFLLAHANPVLLLLIILVELPPVRLERQQSTK